MLYIKSIDPAKTKYGSTIVFAPEKDGLVKFCVE